MTPSGMIRIWKVLGPIFLSVLSLFLSSLIIQKIALFLSPSFNLLLSYGIGKIAIMTLVIIHVAMLLVCSSKEFLQNSLNISIYFLVKDRWIKKFMLFFVTFFAAHLMILSLLFVFGDIVCNPDFSALKISVVPSLFLGFIATFFLAWSEELIFRGVLYRFFTQEISPISGILLSSMIFSLSHDLTNPLSLVTTQWKLGLGLFLLGILFNLIFALTGKLYCSMGAHAGLVFVKVIMRRITFLTFVPATSMHFLFHSDLRQSLLVHAILILSNFILILKHKKLLFQPTHGNISNPTQTSHRYP
jgi:uncharacterized protein